MKKILVFTFVYKPTEITGDNRIVFKKDWPFEILPVGTSYLPFGNSLREGVVDGHIYNEDSKILTTHIKFKWDKQTESEFLDEKMKEYGWTKIAPTESEA